MLLGIKSHGHWRLFLGEYVWRRRQYEGGNKVYCGHYEEEASGFLWGSY